MSIRDSLGGLTKDDVLGMIGLETRRSMTDYLLPAISCFAAGIVVGAGLGLLFAPKPGTELRSDIGEKAATLRTKISDAARTAIAEGEEAMTGLLEETKRIGARVGEAGGRST